MADGPSGRFDIGRVLTDVGRIFRGGWQPIWPLLLILVLVPQLVLAVVQFSLRAELSPGGALVTAGGLSGTAVTHARLLALGWAATAAGAAGLVAGLVGFAGSICATFVSVNFLNGRPTTSREALNRTGQVYLPVFGMGILIGLGVAVGFLLLIVPGLFLLLAWSVSVPVRVTEKIHAVDAISRSFRLTDSFRWPILGVFLIWVCIYLGITLVVGAASVVFRLTGLEAIAALVFSPILQTVVVMAGAAIPASIYHELLRIKEGGGQTVADVFS